MYIPRPFEETRLPVLHTLMKAQPFGTLVTMGAAGLIATHLPMVLHPEIGELGCLRGHIARANVQWREFDPAVEALAIFAGPHHYISAGWYPEKQEHHRVVPTWNYAVVHGYGTLRVIEETDWLLTHLNNLVDRHEAGMREPWKVADAPEDFIRSQTRGIVGLELPLTRLEGKWKVSQNRSERDRRGVVEGLGELDTPESLAMQKMVREKLEG